MRMKLSKSDYELLKGMDFSLINNDIQFDDASMEFETDAKLFDVVFDVNIVTRGMDDKQDQCTEYGRKLYALYDRIFFSAETT